MRSYEDACGITRALDAVGERWALPVVRELVFGPRRYSDLAATLPGVSTNILGTRLKELTQTGVVRKRRLPPPASATVYELTAWGSELEPVLITLGHWAAHTPVDLQNQAFSASSLALSLKTTFDPQAAAEVDLTVRLIMDEDVFDVQVSNGQLTVGRALSAIATPDLSGQSYEVDAQVRADPKALAALVYERLDPQDLGMQVDGSHAGVETFIRCFALPQPPMEGRS